MSATTNRLAECDYDTAPTALYQAIESRDWEAIRENTDDILCQANVWVVRKEATGRLRWRLLPLHAAIIFHAPGNVVERLLTEFPAGAACKDDQGMLPLHLVLRNAPIDFDSLEELLTAHPAGVLVKDRKGRTPLQSGLAAAAAKAEPVDSQLQSLDLYTSIAVAAAVQQQQDEDWPERLAAVTQEHALRLTELRDAFEQEQERRQGRLTNEVRQLQARIVDLEDEKLQWKNAQLVDQQSKIEELQSALVTSEKTNATLSSSLRQVQKECVDIAKACATEHESVTAWQKRCAEQWEAYRSSISANSHRQAEFWRNAQSSLYATDAHVTEALGGLPEPTPRTTFVAPVTAVSKDCEEKKEIDEMDEIMDQHPVCTDETNEVTEEESSVAGDGVSSLNGEMKEVRSAPTDEVTEKSHDEVNAIRSFHVVDEKRQQDEVDAVRSCDDDAKQSQPDEIAAIRKGLSDEHSAPDDEVTANQTLAGSIGGDTAAMTFASKSPLVYESATPLAPTPEEMVARIQSPRHKQSSQKNKKLAVQTGVPFGPNSPVVLSSPVPLSPEEVVARIKEQRSLSSSLPHTPTHP